MVWHEPPLFPGWGPDLVRPAALWPALDPDEVGWDEQASWVWPSAFGVVPDEDDGSDPFPWWGQPEVTMRDAWRASTSGGISFSEAKEFGLTGRDW
jgi:hypothetical protein